jgi:hypothetical protein
MGSVEARRQVMRDPTLRRFWIGYAHEPVLPDRDGVTAIDLDHALGLIDRYLRQSPDDYVRREPAPRDRGPRPRHTGRPPHPAQQQYADLARHLVPAAVVAESGTYEMGPPVARIRTRYPGHGKPTIASQRASATSKGRNVGSE